MFILMFTLFDVFHILFAYLLLSLQITIIERQVFDFLGYMWAPIFVNFFHILFIIFGFYGAYHFRIKYIITVSTSCHNNAIDLLRIKVVTMLNIYVNKQKKS